MASKSVRAGNAHRQTMNCNSENSLSCVTIQYFSSVDYFSIQHPVGHLVQFDIKSEVSFYSDLWGSSFKYGGLKLTEK